MRNRNERDEDAEAQAAHARQMGTEIIEDHLSHHLQQNPDSSFVTWIACLHPENAEVTIDQRFLIPGNPWWTVYEGAKNDVPTATATPMADLEPEAAVTVSPGNHQDGSGSSRKKNESAGLDLIVGCILSISAISAVFGMEAAAFLIYWISAGFYRLAQSMHPPNVVTGIWYSICLLVYYSLALVDSCLLLASVLTTEIVAGALFLVSGLLAGCHMAGQWHQYVRRTCHWLRWAFRSDSMSAHPPRHFCLTVPPQSPPDDGDDDGGDGIVPQPVPATGSVAVVQGKDHWLDLETTVTPTAPPPVAATAPLSEEHVIVLDDCNVFVEPSREEEDGKNDKASW